MLTLSILEPQLDDLVAAIFAEQPNEGAAFLICGISRTDREERLLVREVVPVERAHYLGREPQRLSIDSQAYANVAKRAQADGSSVVFVHSHPGGVGEFSPRNLQTVDERANQMFAARVKILAGRDSLRAGMAAMVEQPK